MNRHQTIKIELCSKCKNKMRKNLCKDCKKLYRREKNLRQVFGITSKQYQILFETQKGCCAICKIHQSKLKRPLAIDHNHKTGIIRGLLCDKCNITLGTYETKKKQLEKYLKTVPQRMIKIYKEWMTYA